MQIEIDQLIKEKRKTISLKIDENGCLIVKVPHKISDTQIKEILAKRADWIISKKNLIQKHIADNHRNFVIGEKFLFLGRMMEVKADDEMKHIFNFDGNSFFIQTKHEDKLKFCLEQLYLDLAKRVIIPRVHSISQDINIPFRKVRLTNAGTRWGSCSGMKNININRRLIMAPSDVLNYVIIHELCHIVHMDHSKDFWGLVKKIMPDYQVHKKWLKDNGHRLKL